MRNDLHMRKGKMVAQGAHASISFATDLLLSEQSLSKVQRAWVTQGMTKICVRVDSETELLDISKKAALAGLTVEVITDSGKTEFNGVPTRTCLCIGPNEAKHIDTITGHLKLL